MYNHSARVKILKETRTRRVRKMKSILFLVFAALCSASLPRYSNEGVDMAERAPTMYDAATDEDITAYLKQALEQDTELKSFLADLDDDDGK
jgi:hypothetical protein